VTTRPDESELVERAAAGDDDAFAALMDRYRDAVCAIAYSYLGSFEDVQDVAQETFVQA
jgi:RNA polymerase sigma-70 factor (ECF subfamily)